MDNTTVLVMDLLANGAITRDQAHTLLTSTQSPSQSNSANVEEPIAVIGVAANLPHARNYSEFWNVLTSGTNCNEQLPDERRALCSVLGHEEQTYLRGSWISGIEFFDYEFFGITPAEALSMDPQQRRFLEVAYHCLEDAGWAGRVRGTRTGVYGSFDDGDYRLGYDVSSPVDIPGRVGSFAASRLSYLFDLRGPASVTSCTCSSSALALHQACLGLRAGDSDMAIVGGANLLSFPVARPSLLADASGIMSADSTCRPFDNGARGAGRGEGVVAVMLKPLSVARQDGDRIRGTIHASTVNNDGRSAMLTAPNPKAQSELLLAAWQKAGWHPSEIDYIEAHGTGTELGDPIEIKALSDAADDYDVPSQSIALGSVKGNIGHLLDGAAGLAGIIKALLVLEHREVPPTVNVVEPSRHINFLDSPIFLPTGSWPLAEPQDRPLRVGVSSFGFNGTNAHVLLQGPEHPNGEVVSADADELIFVPVSARTRGALIDVLEALAKRGSRMKHGERLVDFAWTLGVGREHQECRVGLLVNDVTDLITACQSLIDSPQASWDAIPGVVTAETSTGNDNTTAREAREWVSGGQYDATHLARHNPRIVSAPLYPFNPSRVWPETSRTNIRSVSPSPIASEGAPMAEGYSPLEICLEAVSEALGIPDVGPGDSFLALGGSSLAALKIQADLRSKLGIDINSVDILSAHTIRELGDYVAEQKETR